MLHKFPGFERQVAQIADKVRRKAACQQSKAGGPSGENQPGAAWRKALQAVRSKGAIARSLRESSRLSGVPSAAAAERSSETTLTDTSPAWSTEDSSVAGAAERSPVTPLIGGASTHAPASDRTMVVSDM